MDGLCRKGERDVGKGREGTLGRDEFRELGVGGSWVG